MKKWHKGLVIGLGALVLSTLGIQASDLLQGVDSNMLGLVNTADGPCSAGSVILLLGERSLCVDVYEASLSENCSVGRVVSQIDTETALSDPACVPESKPEKDPWAYVSLTEAQQLCARVGKRLPTNEEWYKAVSGFGDQSTCVTKKGNSSPLPTGTVNCVSPLGVHDLIGNVWEWIDDEVVDGIYNNRQLPESGYVSEVDRDGVVSVTEQSAVSAFGDDYAWTNDRGVRAIIRGGFYGSGDDAGIYSQNLAVSTNFRTAGVGFRCVKDI